MTDVRRCPSVLTTNPNGKAYRCTRPAGHPAWDQARGGHTAHRNGGAVWQTKAENVVESALWAPAQGYPHGTGYAYPVGLDRYATDPLAPAEPADPPTPTHTFTLDMDLVERMIGVHGGNTPGVQGLGRTANDMANALLAQLPEGWPLTDEEPIPVPALADLTVVDPPEDTDPQPCPSVGPLGERCIHGDTEDRHDHGPVGTRAHHCGPTDPMTGACPEWPIMSGDRHRWGIPQVEPSWNHLDQPRLPEQADTTPEEATAPTFSEWLARFRDRFAAGLDLGLDPGTYTRWPPHTEQMTADARALGPLAHFTMDKAGTITSTLGLRGVVTPAPGQPDWTREERDRLKAALGHHPRRENVATLPRVAGWRACWRARP